MKSIKISGVELVTLRKRKKPIKEFDELNKAWDKFLYEFCKSIGVVWTVEWLNKKLGGEKASQR